MTRFEGPVARAGKWATTQLVGVVNDPQGLTTPFIGSERTVYDETTVATTSVVAHGLADNETEPLRDRLQEAFAKSARVVFVSLRTATAPEVGLRHLDDWLLSRVAPVAFTREEGWWGATLVLGEAEQPRWDEIALTLESELAEKDDDLRVLRTEQDEIREGLVEALDELRTAGRELELAATENSRLEALLSDVSASLEDARANIVELTKQVRKATETEAELTKQVRKATEAEAALRKDLAAKSQRLDEAKRRVKKLSRDRDVLRHRLATERWKLRSMRNRRWWRLGTLLASVVRRPHRFNDHFRIVRDIVRPPAAPKRPAAPEPTTRQSVKEEPLDADVSRSETRAPTIVVQATVERPAPPEQWDDLVVAAILDEMTNACFAPECHIVSFTPNNWQDVLTTRPPHFLLVESAWRGNQGSWEYKVGTYSYPQSVGLPDLTQLIEWCRANDIPTVFWNKEDPVHFHKFKEAAQLFDVIFTTDSNQIEAYKALGLEDRTVDALPFAAQPTIHYPAPLRERDPRPVFAGTFYRNRHPERMDQMEMLLDAALDQDLLIYDRMNGKVNESFGYPERFNDQIIGGVPYREMVALYRKHRVFLNVNSVVDSPTMMSRRVFELLASGTPVVSTPSRALSAMFGDAVTTVENREEAAEAIEHLLLDDQHWTSISKKGLLAVAKEHLYRDRLVDIAAAAGISFRMRPRPHFVEPSSVDQISSLPPADTSSPVVFRAKEGSREADELVAISRLVDAPAIAFTPDAQNTYQRARELPEGPLIVSTQALAQGLEPAPGVDVSGFGGVFLLPQ